MIDLAMMAGGLAALGAAFNREVTPGVADVYHGVIGPKLDAEGWSKAVRRALECERYFPSPAVLLCYGLADGAPQARAVEQYEQVLELFESGKGIGPRQIREKFGSAAMEAFVASGGTRAFSWCEPESEPFRRKAWVEAWLETTEQDPSRALPSGDQPELLHE